MARWSAVLIRLAMLLALVGCSQQAEPEAGLGSQNSDLADSTASASGLVAVAANRGPNVEDGFRGDVHELLIGALPLDVNAYCAKIGRGRGFAEGYFPQQFRRPFDEFSIAQKVQAYSARDFSAFLPQQVGQPGQIWELDVDRVEPFLKQFHAGAALKLVAPGRRSGPNGGFGVLRAVSESRLEILA